MLDTMCRLTELYNLLQIKMGKKCDCKANIHHIIFHIFIYSNSNKTIELWGRIFVVWIIFFSFFHFLFLAKKIEKRELYYRPL